MLTVSRPAPVRRRARTAHRNPSAVSRVAVHDMRGAGRGVSSGRHAASGAARRPRCRGSTASARTELLDFVLRRRRRRPRRTRRRSRSPARLRPAPRSRCASRCPSLGNELHVRARHGRGRHHGARRAIVLGRAAGASTGRHARRLRDRLTGGLAERRSLDGAYRYARADVEESLASVGIRTGEQHGFTRYLELPAPSPLNEGWLGELRSRSGAGFELPLPQVTRDLVAGARADPGRARGRAARHRRSSGAITPGPP